MKFSFEYPIACVALLFTCLAFAIPTAQATADDSLSLYLGTYTHGDSKGIYQARLDLETGKLHGLKLAAELESPSFLTFHPTNPLVYAVGELGKFKGEDGGAVSALQLDPKTGNLKLLNQQCSGGAHPCHVSVTPCGKYVAVANYSGGSVACYPIEEDGSLGAMTGFVQHEGSSVNQRRQNEPHAHSINSDPSGRFVYAADLGCDKIFIYRLDGGKLVPSDPAFVALAPGSGPRHFTFHPEGRFAFVINELLSTVTALQFNADTGGLAQIQTVTTLPDGFEGNNTTAEVQVHPSGKFLYGSNRGHDSIAAFRINRDSGKLTPLGQTPSGGKSPRNFAIDPTGAYLLAAHQTTNNVVVFRINQDTGRLEPTGNELAVGAPVCVKFAPN